MSFNKIKALLNGGSENIIRKALSRSKILEMSEDQSKVRRKESAPVKTQEMIDESTIYVEQIPINSTHESLTKTFEKFGKVNYVSLPRYKKSRQIKQFGFIEFDDSESINSAISAFRKFDGVLQYASLKAENLLSITTHDKEEPTVVAVAKPEEPETDEPPTKKARVEIVEEEKVQKMESEDEVKDAEEDPASTQEDEKETDEGEDETSAKPGEPEADGEVTKKKKKNRRHKKKKVKKGFFDEHVMAMKIMRKIEWKKMRNAYLNLERQKAKEIKKILRDTYNKRNNNKTQENQKFSPVNTASPRINFYGSPNDREDPVDQKVQTSCEPNDTNTSSGLTFAPGVIVNIKFREPCLDFAELKKEFKQFSYVSYVDILESGSQCYVRVNAPTFAQELVCSYSSCEYETEILKDEAEKEYWKKIFEKRDMKKGREMPKKEQPVKKRRGREKLMAKINKAAQHIRFEENEDVVE